VDIHTASFSMSEALNALPNLSISSSQIFKQEIPSPPSKNEQSNGSPLGESFQNSILMIFQQELLKVAYALSFYGSKMILDHPNHFA
jgi:hypothetical protein